VNHADRMAIMCPEPEPVDGWVLQDICREHGHPARCSDDDRTLRVAYRNRHGRWRVTTIPATLGDVQELLAYGQTNWRNDS